MSARTGAAAWRDTEGGLSVFSERDLHRERIARVLRGEKVALPSGRLEGLAERFCLSSLDTDVLAVLWVGAFDSELRAQLVEKEPGTGQITARLVTALFAHPIRARLSSGSPLWSWQMVQEHPLIDGSAALSIDAAIIAWLEEQPELDRVLAGRVHLLAAPFESPRWRVDALAARIVEGLERGQRLRVHLESRDAVAARWFAAALGRRLGLSVFGVPPAALGSEPEAAVRLHRQAYLDGAIPCVALADATLSTPPGVPPYPLQVVYGHGVLPRAGFELQDLECEVPAPDVGERESLWRLLWPQCVTWPQRELAELALRPEATADDIVWAAGTAPATAREAAQALRERNRGDIGPLVRRIESNFEWDDLVLPKQVHERLKEIAFEARERVRVWTEPGAARLFPYGRGLIALFAGVPGTGKTMAAQVIAADLGLDLLTVDLSAVVSKWVGETARHLQQLLSSRAAQCSLLFFDEADALYAKRVEEVRDAHDRFANLDSSHLMTALESYPGVVLLASNLKANIDGAFLRRIRHVVDFPKPGLEERERIWRQIVGGLFPLDSVRRLDPGLARLARVEATGAVIKNAVLSALFAARYARCAPSLAILGEMLARELAKEGVNLSVRELAALLEAEA